MKAPGLTGELLGKLLFLRKEGMVKAALAQRGALNDDEADEFEARTREIREDRRSRTDLLDFVPLNRGEARCSAGLCRYILDTTAWMSGGRSASVSFFVHS